MNKPSPKQLTVLNSTKITANMQRITLQGAVLADFSNDCAGNYIKLLFNSVGDTDLSTVSEDDKPIMRTYTIRSFSPINQTIEIDFVRHITEDLQCGFAARWAMNAKKGDIINIVGPGTIKDMNTHADWFLMVADMTALPALSAKIKNLPNDAKGYAIIKVIENNDIQLIEAPSNFKVIWITNEESLASTVKSLTWLDGIISIWTACEFDSMRQLRSYFRTDKQVAHENIYISSYWKQGVSEDGHKVIKKKDANENNVF